MAKCPFRLAGQISVKDYGAHGTGIDDDTAHIQAAIDACASGGTVLVPAGTYRVIVPVPTGWDWKAALYLKSNMRLRLAEGATIKADTQQAYRTGTTQWNAPYTAGIIGIKARTNVIIDGTGVIEGSRDAQANPSECFPNVMVLHSTNVTLKDIETRKAWGDGVLVCWDYVNEDPNTDCENVTFNNVYAHHNSRHGITFDGCNVGTLIDTDCLNNDGFSWSSGIGFEADGATAQNQYITHTNCKFNSNGKAGSPLQGGVYIYSVKDHHLTFTGCEAKDNFGTGFVTSTVVTTGNKATYITLTDCTATGNAQYGAIFHGDHDDVNGGTFTGNTMGGIYHGYGTPQSFASLTVDTVNDGAVSSPWSLEVE